jgi:Glycosyl hydrolases family 39/PKD domain
MFAPLVSLRAARARFAWLLIAVGLLFCTSLSESQTVTANFGDRSGSTPAVPAGLFSVGGAGSSIIDPGPLATLTTAGLDRTRFWISLQQVYANKNKPNFNYLDNTLEVMKAAGLHPLAVIYNTPASLASQPCAPPSDIWQWGQMAASVVAHVDQKFPGVVQDYEIWNEPELAPSLCISNPTTRLNTYVWMFAEAAAAMHKQADADGETIRTGGPVISQLSQAPTWIPALLKNSSAAPYVDFVSFHLYVTGQTNIDDGMTWPQLYAITQSPTRGLAAYYKDLELLVRSGYQPHAASTPIYITEFNDNWAYATDCCRNNPTYGPLWNTVAIVDLLNVVYSGATAVPSQLSYFNSVGSYFCILGRWNATMNCDASAVDPYPQYYAYKLFASPDYLDLQTGGHMAASVSPANTTSGLDATAFYTSTADDLVIINPTSTSYSSVAINVKNIGLRSPSGIEYLLNRSSGEISSEPVKLYDTSTGYWATLDVPAYSTVALSVKGESTGESPKAVLSVSTLSGPHPLAVSINSSASQGGGSEIVGRTITFGDGAWLTWNASTTHTYTKPGKYFIGLTVKNASGQYSSTGTAITVR